MAMAAATLSPPQVHHRGRVSVRLARRTAARTCFWSDGGGVQYNALVRSAVRSVRWVSYAYVHPGHTSFLQ
jgi:hypothetical protein